MNVKIITLSFNTLSGEFDDAEFSEFIVNKEILSVSEHFFIKNDSPYLTLIIKHSHSEKSFVPESKSRLSTQRPIPRSIDLPRSISRSNSCR